MEAESRRRRFVHGMLVGSLILLCGVSVLCGPTAHAASLRTQNFIIEAPTPQLAQAVAEAAERYRRDLAIHWLGAPLPAWPAHCPIRVVAGPNLAAQGVTTYNQAPVRDFQMEVVGTPERILDSVLPHEITHTILATYFGRPLPRWADEGICTTVEHVSERNKHEIKLREFLRSRRGIAMNQLFRLTEYPSDVLPMYAQGYSVCRFLIDQKGPRTFIAFLGDYMKHPSWTTNIKKHYDYNSLAELQEYWLAWVSDGSGSVDRFAKTRPPASSSTASIAQNNVRPVTQPGVQPAAASLAGNVANQVVPATATMELTPPKSESLALHSPQGQLANAQVANAQGPSSDPHAAPALASTGGGNGWYERKREEIQANQTEDGNGSSQVSTPMVPPSIRSSGTYRTAHPQPEQQMSRAGQSLNGAPPMQNIPPHQQQAQPYQGSPRRY